MILPIWYLGGIDAVNLSCFFGTNTMITAEISAVLFFYPMWEMEVFLMENKNDKLFIIIAGVVIGIIAAGLAFLGNPKNMGF